MKSNDRYAGELELVNDVLVPVSELRAATRAAEQPGSCGRQELGWGVLSWVRRNLGWRAYYYLVNYWEALPDSRRYAIIWRLNLVRAYAGELIGMGIACALWGMVLGFLLSRAGRD